MIDVDLENLPINITSHIKNFRCYLVSCWQYVDNLLENHNWDDDGNFIDDWLDSNWKMFVERELLEGYGLLTPLSIPISDDFLSSSLKKYTVEARVTDHQVFQSFESKFSLPSQLRLFGFSTRLDKGGFGLYPPFDTADLVMDKKNEVFTVPFELLDFYLVEFDRLAI